MLPIEEVEGTGATALAVPPVALVPFPSLEKSGPVTEIIRENPTFDDIPILKSFHKDAGKFITFGLTATKHPETGIRNLGVYRIQILDSTHALMHWQKHKRGAEHHDLTKSTKTEVAIVIGGEPATVFSGVAPVPEGLDKYLFAGITRKKGIKMIKCKTIDVEVPANAEIVLEGYVDSSDIRDEGPFGDHTGYYTLEEPYPVMKVSAVTMKKDRTFLATVVGKPPLEDKYMGWATGKIFFPLLKTTVPNMYQYFALNFLSIVHPLLKVL